MVQVALGVRKALILLDESLFEIVRESRVMTLHIDDNENLTRVQGRR